MPTERAESGGAWGKGTVKNLGKKKIIHGTTK